MGSARMVAEESIDHLIPRPPFDHLQYLDERIITLVRKHLRRHDFFRSWWDSPRLYALLRMLQCDESTVLRFQNTSINDYWLPIDEGTFKTLGTNVDWDDFRRMQRRVLSNYELMSEAELLATPHVHRHLEWGDDFFEEGEHLGEGTSAQVLKVQHVSLDNRHGSFYACKRATRGKGKGQRDRVQLFINELHILRRIKHPHTVKLVTSYTDNSNFALVLSPVADESLKEMLEGVPVPLRRSDRMLLLQSFACLVSALSYLHSMGVRHKDIKPSNIVLSKGRVYLCDFGVSNDWTGNDPVTEGPTHRTPGYCAPENLNFEQRTDAQDVWSMGRVFCEIFTVAAGRTLESLLQQIGGNVRDIYTEEGLEAMRHWLAELEIEEATIASKLLRQTIDRMMATDPAVRPKGKHLVAEFGAHWPYVGDCCQDAYGRSEVPVWSKQFIHSSSLQGPPPNELSHPFSKQGSPLQLAVPSKLTLNGSDVQSLGGRNDLTLPPNVRVPSGWSTGQDSVEDTADNEFLSSSLLERQLSMSDYRNSAAYSSAESQRLDAWSSGSATSPHQTPRASLVSRTDRRTSFGASSTQSEQLVRWSSGPVLPLKPESISLSLTCNCTQRQNRHRIRERLILTATDVDLSIDADQPTIEATDCDLPNNMLHVYESYSRQSNDRYRVWLKTRRLAFSRTSRATGRQRCYSFWLPLTDITSKVEENRLTLCWSDCNQWKARPLRNNKQSCDCVYSPENPNNKITISFVNTETAVAFLSNLCAVYDDLGGAKHWRNVEIIDRQRVLVVDVGDQANIHHRIACLATQKSALYSSFQVFIHWPDLDLDIRVNSSQGSGQRNMVISFDQVSTPNYSSNITNEPWVDKSKVAECVANDLVLGAYTMSFPFEAHVPSRFPDGVKQMLEYLTGWSICFFAPNVQLAKDNLIRDTKYGLSDVILWTRYHSTHDAFPKVQITFRHRRAKPNYVWRSASVDVSVRLAFSLTTAEFAVTHKSHGDMLHTPTMSAVDKKGAPSSSDKSTKLELQFETSEDLTALVKVFDDLQKAVRRDSLVKVPTNGTLARVSKDLFRRRSNTGQGTG